MQKRNSSRKVIWAQIGHVETMQINMSKSYKRVEKRIRRREAKRYRRIEACDRLLEKMNNGYKPTLAEYRECRFEPRKNKIGGKP